MIAILHTGKTTDALGVVTTQSEVLFPSVEVLAVGDVSLDSVVDPSAPPKDVAPTTLVTVALQPEQLQRLVLATASGALYLALLGPGASVPDGTPITTPGQEGEGHASHPRGGRARR
jgi:Flp pilus assembly protein CpaB